MKRERINTKRLPAVIFGILLGTIAGFSQDTLTVMHYNLLNYGNNYGSCTGTNNNVDDKNLNLKTITEYIRPDILTVNEISEIESYHQLLLNTVFNYAGSGYQMADPPNYAGSGIMNQVFYKTEKLQLVESVTIVTNIRDIDIFRFRCRKVPPAQNGDSVFLNLIVAHFKAGNDTYDINERADEANRIMNWLNDTGADGNYLFMGDLNVYSGYEAAFQKIVNHSNPEIRFYDPVNMIGEWHENSYYSDVHTQSTHQSGTCHSGGGLDDRFDFILMSDEILNGDEGIRYISNSYEAVGQDGLHFNKSVNATPTNYSVPSDVLEALYDLSDHLPVICRLFCSGELAIAGNKMPSFRIETTNPFNGEIIISVFSDIPQEVTLKLYSDIGQMVLEHKCHVSNKSVIRIPTGDLPKGIYILKAGNPSTGYRTSRLIGS